MNLEYTPAQCAFRAEIRAWLAEHVPREPLLSSMLRRIALRAFRFSTTQAGTASE